MVPMVRPFQGTRLITQVFGPTNNPSEPALGAWAHFHRGVDYAMPIGTPVYASGDGTVVAAGWDSTGYGNTVVVDHGIGLRSRVAHLVHINVSVGQHVTKETALGESGSSGNSTGPHLHWELTSDGWPIHPFLLVVSR